MNCPVCKRELAPTLSICLTCGAMMNDTVREELETKIGRPSVASPRPEVPKFEPIRPWTPEPVKMSAPSTPTALEMEPADVTTPVSVAPIVSEPIKMEIVEVIDPPPAPATVIEKPRAPRPRPITAQLNRKETSPTLVDFQPANPTIPDWRLQLQNSIRKRSASGETVAASAPAVAAVAAAPVVQRDVRPQVPSPPIQNEKLANAMKRIEASKRTYGSAAAVAVAKAKMKKPAVPNRAFPFNVIEKAPGAATTPSVQPAPPVTQETPKPKLVSSLRIEKKKFDTNKLPPIPEPDTPLPVEIAEEPDAATEVRTKVSFDRMSIKNAPEPDVEEIVEQDEFEEIDDLAPLSMRFGSAVFDLIIGGFAAGIILTPILVSNANIASLSGGMAIIGTIVFVMFLYQTLAIAFMGRTFGMKLFSIEIIDAEANELPTLHQAAVHSAVYLLSLLLLGVGFIPAFFNEERRAMHDLLSGTLLIREY